MFNILVVDDEIIIQKMLRDLLEKEGYNVICASDGLEALEKFNSQNFDLVITDLTMPRLDGKGLLKQIKKESPETIVIIITAFANLESAVSIIREGASDYIVKPFIIDEILFKIRNLLNIQLLSKENISLKNQLHNKYNFSNIVGKSNGIMEVINLIKKISIAKSNVLINGESGTGKELVARAIHANSAFKNGPFLGINCSAIPENLLESELFGYKKGAFTGAYKNKEGLFISATDGTLFLDEIGDMPVELQIKLLRALEERIVQPIGSKEMLSFNARIISATNKNLAHEIEKGKFREDLYYRLNVVEIKIPPLRHRKEDLPLLIKHFISKKNIELGLSIKNVDSEAMHKIQNYKWKGNIRELENIIERAMILCDAEIISSKFLPNFIKETMPKAKQKIKHHLSLKEAVKNFENNYIHSILEETNGDKKEASKILKMSLSSLYRRLEENNT